MNPVTSQESSPFSNIEFTDSLNNRISYGCGNPSTVRAYYPAKANGTLDQNIEDFKTLAVYSFTYTTVIPLSPGASFSITYPDTVTVPSNFKICEVYYDGDLFQMDC